MGIDKMSLYEQMLAKQKRTEEHQRRQKEMTQKEAVQMLLNEPQLKDTSFNLPTWLKENPQAQAALDTGTKKQSAWKNLTKQTELRAQLRDESIKPTARKTTYTQHIASNNQVLKTEQFPDEPEIQTPITLGRNETISNTIQPSETIEIKEESYDYSNLLLIGGISFIGILFLILWRKK
tara:strand:+ start:1390 stop:1926 length:537 start_codon:yes stop_codon:yes gene_type:complete